MFATSWSATLSSYCLRDRPLRPSFDIELVESGSELVGDFIEPLSFDGFVRLVSLGVIVRPRGRVSFGFSGSSGGVTKGRL